MRFFPFLLFISFVFTAAWGFSASSEEDSSKWSGEWDEPANLDEIKKQENVYRCPHLRRMCPVVEATSLPDDDSLAVENAQRTNIIIAVDKSVVFVYNPQPANLQHETICHIVIASNIFLLYVLYGNAKQYISDRMYQHKNDIKNIDKNYKKTGLVQHVSETRHKFYFEGVAIMHNEPNTYRRKMLEAMTKSENQGWTGRIFIHDVKEKLNINNLWKPYSKHRTKLLAEQFERVWKLEVESCSKIHKRPSLIRTVFRTYWLDFVILASIHLLSYVADVVIRPTLVKTILNYFTAKDLVTPTEFYIAGVETIVFSIFSRFLTAHYTFGSITSGMILRTACTSLIYKKSLCISSQALREISSGQVINLISNDVSRFDNIVMTGNFLWSTPIVASFICYMIYVEAGVAGIPGFFVIILVCIAQGYGARVTSQCRRKIAVKTDERIRITDEVLNGIHVVKMHAWEIPFYNLILKARKLELKEIFKANCVRGIFMGFTILTRRTAICFTLITYVVLGKSLSASMVYVLIMYFGMVSGLLTGTFIRGIGELAEGLVSFRRIEDFLLSGELSSIKEKEDLNKNVDDLPHGDPIVTLKDVTSSWMENSNEYALKAITMTARKGQTTMVVGSTGSGKSSLLQLICGEMKTVMGTVSVSGSISYSSQEPWVFGGTIKENILFGTPYDRDRYEEVISVCCLERDLDLFINGDMETVGEKGASLSGGQRARINLARAIYKDADIYLLDDPLSAVDAHVSKSIFQNCIQEFLKKKTVILATHQVQFMKYVDNIVLMKNGFIENEGTFLELLSAGHECIKSLQKNIPETKGDFDVKEKIEMKKWPSLQRIVSCDDSISIVSIVSDMEDMDIPRPVNKDSEYEYKGSPYIDYLKTGKSIILPFVFMFFFIGAQVFANISDYFINIWINKEEEEELIGSATDLTERDEMVFISVYVAIIVGLFISAFSRGFAFFALTQKCSKHLHTILLKSIIFTKMSFFNNNPTAQPEK